MFPQDFLVGIILWANREVKPIRLRARWGTDDLANKGTRTFLAGWGDIRGKSRGMHN